MDIDHVISAVGSAQKCERLESDLELAKADLRKNFKGFMNHAMEVFLVFEMIGVGPPGHKNRPHAASGTASNRSNDAYPSGRKQNPTGEKHVNARKDPPCPFPIRVRKGANNLIKYCNESRDDEKKRMKNAWARKRGADKPSGSTRSQVSKWNYDTVQSASSDRNEKPEIRVESEMTNEQVKVPNHSCAQLPYQMRKNGLNSMVGATMAVTPVLYHL